MSYADSIKTHPPLVSNGILNNNLVQHGAVVQLDQKRISDASLGRIVVVDGEGLVFDTVGLGAESVNAGIGGGCIGAV